MTKITELRGAFCGQLLDNVADAVYVLDRQGGFVYVNRRTTELVGCSRDELTGRPFGVMADAETAAGLDAMLRAVIDEDKSLAVRLEKIRRKDGTTGPDVMVRWCRVLLDDGTPLIAGTMSEERPHNDPECGMLAEFPRHNPYPVLQINKDGVVTYANEAARPVLASWRCEVDEFLPENLRMLVMEVGVRNVKEQIEIASAGHVFALTLVPMKDMDLINVYGNDVTAMKQAEEELRLAYEGLDARVTERTAELRRTNARLMDEIVERKRIEDELRDINAKLKETQSQLLQSEKLASVGQLAAGVAHEINNPVGYVKSNLGTMRRYVADLIKLLDAYEGAETSMGGDMLRKISEVKQQVDVTYMKQDLNDLLIESEEGIRRVGRIVQDLSDFSHVNEAEWQMADVHKCLESTLNIVRNEIKYKADIIKEYGDIPLIECIPSQLNQVFTNLLVNASQAITGRGRIAIRTGRRDGQVWIEVSDNGSGISPEHIERIFDPFFTTKPVGKGTGLGLSLSYGIVKKHCGRIEVKSEFGSGTSFTVWLPIARTDGRGDQADFNTAVCEATFSSE